MRNRVAFISPEPWSPAAMLRLMKRMTPQRSGIWKSVSGVESLDEADFLVVMDSVHGKFQKDLDKFRGRIIQIQREPLYMQPFCEIQEAVTVSYESHFHAVTWWLSYSYDEIQHKKVQKKKRLSTIASPKWVHRNDFNRRLSKLNPLYDVYGRPGMVKIAGDNYRGSVKWKEEGLEEYWYSIAIENGQERNYFSEKIVDCLLLSTMPFYWGCPNIGDFFPEGSWIDINLHKPEEIIEVIIGPVTMQQRAAMEEAKHLILNKYNIWEVLHNTIT